MPHIIIEFSKGACEKPTLESFFERAHNFVVEALPTQLSSCKSRALEHTIFRVGEGNPEDAFIHLTLKVLPGRAPETLEKVSQGLLTLLSEHLKKEGVTHKKTGLSVEIQELSYYHKISLND
ncbi:MAG: 5-carboxymethyl-2-hydroxymuconate Delta-isomerase [Alphaproteobacteria bacterium]|jgi:5-carboxymethyl-2-hydroxymuconate isomerase|nr:5-carboxymethyl-2-hydroxymuconate Delta-isomerase [Alphaproteobacteria bacterium]